MNWASRIISLLSLMCALAAWCAAQRPQVRVPEVKPQVLESDQSAPAAARAEMERGVAAIQTNDLGEAEKRFRRALELYPRYARAENNLGVVWMRRGERERGAAAFERALALAPRYAEALVNLAKVRALEKQHAEAEKLLARAVEADAQNAEALTILAELQLAAHRYEQAAATAVRVHELAHERFAIAHYIAGQAYELAGRDIEAMAEYRIFLKESPTGAAAEKARAALERLRER